MVLGLTSVNIHPHKIDLCKRDAHKTRKKDGLTFPKISLILFPDGDMTCFLSGDLIRGSGSSSRVAGLRHDKPPLLLPEELTTSPGDDSLTRLDEEVLPPALASLPAMLPVLDVMLSLVSALARGEELAPPDL